MEKTSMKQIMRFINNDTGAELAEYAVAVALLVAIALVVYATLGDAINNQNSGTAAKVKEASSKTFPF
jgi:Flp pilus assembly pilin Flp